MGSAVSTPKVPQRQVIYVLTPIVTPAVTQNQSTTPDSEKLAKQARKKSLLTHQRDMICTSATSLRGFSPATNDERRRTKSNPRIN